MKISVCIATYNGQRYIAAQLESILKQLSVNDEVIISDDSSTDNTIDVIKTFNDKRIKLYENNRFHNPALNFENALKETSGDIIFLSDQDDIWLDNKVKVMAKLLHSYDLVVSDCILIDEDETVLNNSYFKLRRSGPGFIHNIYKNSYLGCCIAFKRHILEKALPFPKAIPMHDMWLGMIVELFGKPYFCREQLVKYRRHSSNLSPTLRRNTYSVGKKFKFRLILLYHTIRRYIKCNSPRYVT
ncbi:MAG: glycosyltransferase family 2 protein [Planctomycetota bacterium]|jgi:glycosyltransferase involved in cell wall biosynthesis